MLWFWLALILTVDNQSFIQFHGPFKDGYECALDTVSKKEAFKAQKVTILFQSPCFQVPKDALKE